MRIGAGVFTGVSVCDDVGAADWVRAVLRPWDRGTHRVATLVPADYAAHARILHRAGTRTEDVRWAEIAALTGQRLHAETQYAELIRWHADSEYQGPPEPWVEPERGSLRRDECAAAAEALARYTTTPGDCWFCVWEGYGSAWTILNRLAERSPRVGLEHRTCLLFRGPVTAATAFHEGPWFQSPTLWWPDDRAWCVASELDIYSTYVAAAPSVVRALINDSALEVIECSPENDVDHGPYSAWPDPAGNA